MNEPDYPTGDESCPYSWLNEWLCEYVDGTMDPSLQMVFEEYVQANPELKEHIEQLQHTREMLCGCEESLSAPEEVCAQVRGTVEGDMLRSPRTVEETVREHPIATVVSSVMVALVVGMFTGAMLLAPSSLPSDDAGTAAAVKQQSEPPARPLLRSATQSSPTFRALETPPRPDLLPPMVIGQQGPVATDAAIDSAAASYDVVSRTP